ncbi:translation elongation factor 4 [Patescibacteria group bacterium]|nr:translation elongation factor 4 [Patescibacteria group bacterium]
MPINQSNIRNFCIISHIDHGKSTLADRFLELTGTVEKRKMQEQFLDMMELEREKGITIKLQPVRMEYQGQILNLIDTPGHVDFSYEVSRSLAAVEGAVLLVDASQGVQAQTLANLHLAEEQGLVIIPVINKIDLPHARLKETANEMQQLLGINPEEILKVSAKKGSGVEEILKTIIEKVPLPQGVQDQPLRALIFDSDYDDFKGIIAYVRIIDGEVKARDRILMLASGAEAETLEVGIFRPNQVKVERLRVGEIGYIATGLKNIDQCRVGDTITLSKSSVKPLAGYKEPKPVVFASFYPADSGDYDLLKDSLSKLKLSDASLKYEPESSEGLGRGFRCGFLGMLHLEIISERLKREKKLDLVITSPSVSYQIVAKGKNQTPVLISSPADLPDISQLEEIREPWVALEVISPHQYLGALLKILETLRGEYQDTVYLSADRVLIKYRAPLSEIIADFYDRLKNITSGYASMNYEMIDYRLGDLVELDILIAGEKVEAFSKIVHRQRAEREGRSLVKKLKEIMPPQLFAVSLQAAIGGKIIAREDIRALRKDVTGYLYGGDVSRKRKLLEKQKKGKKKMKQLGKINIPSEVFLKVLKK